MLLPADVAGAVCYLAVVRTPVGAGGTGGRTLSQRGWLFALLLLCVVVPAGFRVGVCFLVVFFLVISLPLLSFVLLVLLND